MHVREAWRDGLDVISLTEHREYRPHARISRRSAAGAGTGRAACRAARAAAGAWCGDHASRPRDRPPPGPSAARISTRCSYATRSRSVRRTSRSPSTAHAARAASRRNHPQFMGRPAQWYPHVNELFERRLLAGIEVVNGVKDSPEAFGVGARTAPDDPRLQRCTPAHAGAPALGSPSRHPAVHARARPHGRQRGARRTTNGRLARRRCVGRGGVAAGNLGGGLQTPAAATPPSGARDGTLRSPSRTPPRSTWTWRSSPPRRRCGCHRSRCPALRRRCCGDGCSGCSGRTQQIALGVRVRNL